MRHLAPLRRVGAIPLLVWLVWAAPARSQIPVTDVGNLTQNIIQAVQSVITATESVTQTLQGVDNLLPLEGILLMDGIAEDMAAIGAILEDAQGLMQDLQALQALFDSRTAPTTFPALRQRMTAMDEAILNARQYALKTQLLITTVGRTVGHLTELVGGIAALVGNKQGQQLMIQVNATTSKTLLVLTTQTSGHQRMDTLTHMREEVIRTSLVRIDEARWEGWPGYIRGQ